MSYHGGRKQDFGGMIIAQFKHVNSAYGKKTALPV